MSRATLDWQDGRTVTVGTEGDTLAAPQSEVIRNHAAFVWSVADLLRGDYKQSEYGRVILPFTVLRRLDCVLEPTKDAVVARNATLAGKVDNVDPLLRAVVGEQFYNTSPLTMTRVLDDPDNIADNLLAYTRAFSAGARDVLEKFDLPGQVERLRRADLLYLVVSKFCEIDLHPAAVSNLEMGYLYEELIRRFSELSNETAGEHFTPREVIRLMVNLLFIDDDPALAKPGVVKTLLDPACGTGGMLSTAEDHLRSTEPARPPGGLRPGAESGDVRRLPLGHDAQGPGRLAHRAGQLLLRRRPSPAGASTTCWPTRRSAWSGRRSQRRGPGREGRQGLRRSVRGRYCRGSTTARSCSCST